jgi:hypothetical protein
MFGWKGRGAGSRSQEFGDDWFHWGEDGTGSKDLRMTQVKHARQ